MNLPWKTQKIAVIFPIRPKKLTALSDPDREVTLILEILMENCKKFGWDSPSSSILPEKAAVAR